MQRRAGTSTIITKLFVEQLVVRYGPDCLTRVNVFNNHKQAMPYVDGCHYCHCNFTDEGREAQRV